MFNQVVEKWGTAWLKLAKHWLAEKAAMGKHSQYTLKAVVRKQLREKVEAWRQLTHSGLDSQLRKPSYLMRMELYICRSLRLVEKKLKGL